MQQALPTFIPFQLFVVLLGVFLGFFFGGGIFWWPFFLEGGGGRNEFK